MMLTINCITVSIEINFISPPLNFLQLKSYTNVNLLQFKLGRNFQFLNINNLIE